MIIGVEWILLVPVIGQVIGYYDVRILPNILKITEYLKGELS